MIYGKPIWAYDCKRDNEMLSVTFEFNRHNETDVYIINQLQNITELQKQDNFVINVKLLNTIKPFLHAFGLSWDSTKKIDVSVFNKSNLITLITFYIPINHSPEQDEIQLGKIALSNLLCK